MKHAWVHPPAFRFARWLLAASICVTPALAHHSPGSHANAAPQPQAQPAEGSPRRAGAPGITGQGRMRFRLLYASERLPAEARQVLKAAHGGFAVDRRPGKGEVYFSLPGAGILQISADLKTIRLLATADNVRKVNLHNTTLWQAPNGAPYLVFPANDEGKIFTTTLGGELVNTLNAPTGDEEFDHPDVADYFRGKGNFAPTDVEYLEGLYYVTTGYSALDVVLTARTDLSGVFRAFWNDLAFGGKGTEPWQFQTAHGITVPPGARRLDISDRPRSEVKRFSRHGRYLSTLKLPRGSLPCDIDYLDGYAVVGALDGPDRSKGAPIYILENDRLVSTVMPREDLGLENFRHVHNAVLHKVGGRYYIIAQAWNPGDFAILEQVTE